MSRSNIMTSLTQTRWTEPERDARAEQTLVRELRLHPLSARLLCNRGLTDPADADAFLRPDLSQLHDPFGLPDMDKAAHRIKDALASGETIFIHGDYDVDGVTSTAVYVRTLTALGAKLDIPRAAPQARRLRPRRPAAIDWAHEQGATLVITSDCGIQAREAVAYANSLGMTVIVTDHHEPGETLPPAYAVVNPHRHDSTYPFPSLAGVGVAFKTMQARRPAGPADPRERLHPEVPGPGRLRHRRRCHAAAGREPRLRLVRPEAACRHAQGRPARAAGRRGHQHRQAAVGRGGRLRHRPAHQRRRAARRRRRRPRPDADRRPRRSPAAGREAERLQRRAPAGPAAHLGRSEADRRQPATWTRPKSWSSPRRAGTRASSASWPANSWRPTTGPPSSSASTTRRRTAKAPPAPFPASTCSRASSSAATCCKAAAGTRWRRACR